MASSTSNTLGKGMVRPASLGPSEWPSSVAGGVGSSCGSACQTTPGALGPSVAAVASYPYGLELVERNPADHNCLRVLQTFVQCQQQQIALLQSHLRELAASYGHRERSLLLKMAGLHTQMERQARAVEQLGAREHRGGTLEGGTSSSAEEQKEFKVNGQDLSRATHEEAVKAFQLADEPIVVEVLRRNKDGNGATDTVLSNSASTSTHASANSVGVSSSDSGGDSGTRSCNNPEASVVSIAVQTEWTTLSLWSGGEADPLLLAPNGEHIGPVPVVFQSDGVHDDSFEDFLSAELDYEEVTLQRGFTEEKLGLTLCYSSGAEETDTEVYISAICPVSVAGKDGRLREGDQIVQVNGVDITSQKQAEALFAESTEAVTLLVTRPQFQVQYEGFIPLQEEAELLEDLECACEPDASTFLQIPELDEGTCVDVASNPSHQDSGVGQDSVRNEESSEHEAGDQEGVPPPQPLPPSVEPTQQPPPPVTCVTTLPSNARPNIPRSMSHSPLHEKEPMWRTLDGSGKKEEAASRRSRRRDPLMRRADSHGEVHQVGRRLERVDLGDGDRRAWGEVEVEHIYETIPENTESDEPIYSVPYEPGASKNKRDTKREDVEQWVRTGESWLKDGESGGKEEEWVRTNSTHNSHSSTGSDSRKGQEEKGRVKAGSSSGEDRSSSAYNTGESCRSTPLTMELGAAPDQKDSPQGAIPDAASTLVLCSPPEMEDRSMQVNLDSDTYSVISCESCRRCMRLPPLSPGCTAASCAASSSPHQGSPRTAKPAPDSKSGHSGTLPADTMYTNADNLQQTIWLQQQLFKQALLRQQSGSKRGSSPSGVTINPERKSGPLYVPPFARTAGYFAPNLSRYQFVSSPHGPTRLNSGELPGVEEEATTMEWKVKRRPDGSRYIARRPVRNKILRDRAQKIQEERSGLTTDDDAVSELKTGRYWSKEERKRHVELARERRKRQEALLRSKAQSVKEAEVDICGVGGVTPGSGGGGVGSGGMGTTSRSEDRSRRKHVNIVELSQRKMARKKGSREAFDFTTVQEMLAHGNKIAPGSKVMGLLSVTTV